AEVEIAYPKAEAVDLDVLNVEGKSFNIVPTGWAASEVLEITSNNVTRLVSGTKYKNVRWGLISQEGLNNHYLLAYGINPTTNMPATGQATYVGNGVHSYASNGEGIDTYHLSNAKFNVNFADKSLEGSITPANNKPFGSVNEVKLSAKIDGNQFSGKTAEGTETGGRFYGFGASELSGSYINPQATQIGVFGAQKQ
ncbi:transferrin-binding protein-like solute binding protein, partial [uncultured Haemophilus sp.]